MIDDSLFPNNEILMELKLNSSSFIQDILANEIEDFGTNPKNNLTNDFHVIEEIQSEDEDEYEEFSKMLNKNKKINSIELEDNLRGEKLDELVSKNATDIDNKLKALNFNREFSIDDNTNKHDKLQRKTSFNLGIF